jgi:hypothetical protein
MASVNAGFVGKEITALWPEKSHWRLREIETRLFSHSFIARRLEGE